MFKTPIIVPCFFAAILSFPMVVAAAVGDTSVPIDANLNCLDTRAMSGSIAKFQLTPGRYVVSLKGNNMAGGCSTGNPECRIDTVMIRGVDSSTSGGMAKWGLAVKNPTVVDVLGTGNANYEAFIIDGNCSDNTGDTSLIFQKV